MGIGTYIFSCSTKTSSLPVALLSLELTLLSCTERVYHGGISFCCWGYCTGGFDVDGMLPLPFLVDVKIGLH